jgi:glutamate-1-semialdehyde 2,1-aminomutase
MVLGLLSVVIVAAYIGRTLITALLTWRAMALAPVLSRRLSTWVKSYDYADEEFLRADGAGEPWLELRKKALDRLAMFLQAHYAKSIAWGNAIRESFSDLRFTDANRVPFPFVRVMREMLGSLGQVPKPLQSFYAEVMRRKKDDHHASHSNVMNQLLHLISSGTFLYCYVVAFSNLTRAMCFGLASLFVRQFGHAVLEPPCHDKEALLLGFNTRNKMLIVLGYLLLPIPHLVQAHTFTPAVLTAITAVVAQRWFLWTLAVVAGRVLYLVWKYNFRMAMIWFVKLVTDPLTDMVAYCSSPLRASMALLPSQARKSATK